METNVAGDKAAARVLAADVVDPLHRDCRDEERPKLLHGATDLGAWLGRDPARADHRSAPLRAGRIRTMAVAVSWSS